LRQLSDHLCNVSGGCIIIIIIIVVVVVVVLVNERMTRDVSTVTHIV